MTAPAVDLILKGRPARGSDPFARVGRLPATTEGEGVIRVTPPNRLGSRYVEEGLHPSSALRAHDKIDLTIQDLEKRDELVHGLAVVGLIQEPVELGRRCAETANDLAPRK
jgi:hypothetical protein